jgi:hypothetical protein
MMMADHLDHWSWYRRRKIAVRLQFQALRWFINMVIIVAYNRNPDPF